MNALAKLLELVDSRDQALSAPEARRHAQRLRQLRERLPDEASDAAARQYGEYDHITAEHVPARVGQMLEEVADALELLADCTELAEALSEVEA